jgi:hypothetical protein
LPAGSRPSAKAAGSSPSFAAQCDDAADNADLARTQLYDDLVRVIDNEQPAD